jgi:lipoyl(octanoyl) transferase
VSEHCEIWRLGSLDYQAALRLQDRLATERGEAGGVDRLLLVEHPPTYTLGSAARPEHLLLTLDECARRGVRVVQADRGGDITFHGPGQIVGYPILQLARPVVGELRRDVVGYVRRLEQVIIATLADEGVRAYPLAGLTGVWVDAPAGAAKIAAIGVRVTARGVTKHGFALNLDPELRWFDGIVPCGIRDKGVTSLAALTGRPVNSARVAERLVAHFGAVFDRQMADVEPDPGIISGIADEQPSR